MNSQCDTKRYAQQSPTNTGNEQKGAAFGRLHEMGDLRPDRFEESCGWVWATRTSHDTQIFYVSLFAGPIENPRRYVILSDLVPNEIILGGRTRAPPESTKN